MKFHEKLILLRRQKGLSQEELADILQVSRQSVYKWESGINMPDHTKMMAIKDYFNVSFDYLLNDIVDDSYTNDNAEKKPPEFRNVYASDYKSDKNQAGYEHGYALNQTKRIRNSIEIFAKKREETQRILEERGYTNIIFPQLNLCLCYFEDPKNKTFGFFYENAEQFVCPFENYIDVEITNDGQKLTYENRTIITGAGFDQGGLNSIGFGSMPVATLKGPRFFDLTILYFDKSGKTNKYNLSLDSVANYIFADSKNKSAAYIEIVGKCIDDQLVKISSSLKCIKAESEVIKAQAGSLQDIDIEALKERNSQEIKAGNEAKERINAEWKAAKKKRRKNGLIASAAALGAVLAVVLIIWLIQVFFSPMIDKMAAYKIVKLIDSINEVTLSDEDLLSDIGEKYHNLTSDQKKYVKNYSVYTDAKEEFDSLLTEKLTENDPSRTITLDDLCGVWENDEYKIIIKNINNSKAVWSYTYTKATGSESVCGEIANDAPSSELSGYSTKKKRMEGKLYRDVNNTYTSYRSFSATKDENGVVTLYISNSAYTKISSN